MLCLTTTEGKYPSGSPLSSTLNSIFYSTILLSCAAIFIHTGPHELSWQACVKNVPTNEAKCQSKCSEQHVGLYMPHPMTPVWNTN